MVENAPVHGLATWVSDIGSNTLVTLSEEVVWCGVVSTFLTLFS
jgi:hypothetical protein